MNRIDYLDGWRGVAIFLVLFSHFIGSDSINTGRLGVDVFFALSGMLMGNILFNQKMPLRLFYARRISRILPAFFLYVIVIFALASNLGIAVSGKEMLATLLFLRTYIPSTNNIWNSPVSIAHLWSLNVEEHAYILMSLLTFLFVRLRASAALAVLAVLAQLTYIFYLRHPALAPQNPEIRTETAIAYIFYSAAFSVIREHQFAEKLMLGWAGIATFVIAIICYVKNMPWYYQLLPPILLAYTVNTLKYMPSAVKHLLSFKPLRLLGLWSYSIYLWQQPFHDYKTSLTSLVALIGAVATGIISFYFFEQPIRSFLNSQMKNRSDNQITERG